MVTLGKFVAFRIHTALVWLGLWTERETTEAFWPSLVGVNLRQFNAYFAVNEGLAISTARPQYSGITNALVTIGRTEGLRGLYQGVTPNVWGAGASWGLYFFLWVSTFPA